jgi:hypothetical protein
MRKPIRAVVSAGFVAAVLPALAELRRLATRSYAAVDERFAAAVDRARMIEFTATCSARSSPVAAARRRQR